MEESLAIFRELGDKGGITESLDGLGRLARDQGHYGQAHAHFEECLALWRELRHPWGIANALGSLAIVAQAQGDHEKARALLEEASAVDQQQGEENRRSA